MATPRIDAHHHLWRYSQDEFSWIGEDAAALRQDFLPENFVDHLLEASIDLAIPVQARCSMEETLWLLQCAAASSTFAKVVGWAPLASQGFAGILEELAEHPRLAGFREIVQDQPPGFLLEAPFREGIGQLTRHGLTYDLLIRAGQLPEAIKFVDLHPHQAFVLDHAAKPAIAGRQLEPWRSLLKQLAERPHVMCKLSGLVTEANWQRWTENDLHPYLDTCLEAFGPARCMAGSDWPVCLLATSYGRWWTVLERWAAPLSSPERDLVLGGTAATFYGCSGAPESRKRGTR